MRYPVVDKEGDSWVRGQVEGLFGAGVGGHHDEGARGSASGGDAGGREGVGGHRKVGVVHKGDLAGRQRGT